MHLLNHYVDKSCLCIICVRAISAFVQTSAFLQPVVRGQVYIFEISPPLHVSKTCCILHPNNLLLHTMWWQHKWRKYDFRKSFLWNCNSYCVSCLVMVMFLIFSLTCRCSQGDNLVHCEQHAHSVITYLNWMLYSAR